MSDDRRTILEALARPFPADRVQWKPGATSKDSTKAMAVAYVDSRVYMARLDEVDPAWSNDFEVHLSPDRVMVLCRLTVRGLTRCGDGETGAKDENALTSASAQAFKRACVAHGLGRYLYDLPTPWVGYDKEHRRLTGTPTLPEWARPRPGPGAAAPAGEGQPAFACAACGQEIGAFLDANGKEWSVSQLVDLAASREQPPTCGRCLVEAAKKGAAGGVPTGGNGSLTKTQFWAWVWEDYTRSTGRTRGDADHRKAVKAEADAALQAAGNDYAVAKAAMGKKA